ncbi:hypothetical protein Tco_0416271, partial [Tanacetum coccineum]
LIPAPPEVVPAGGAAVDLEGEAKKDPPKGSSVTLGSGFESLCKT